MPKKRSLHDEQRDTGYLEGGQSRIRIRISYQRGRRKRLHDPRAIHHSWTTYSSEKVSGAVARRSAHELSQDYVVDEWCIAHTTTASGNHDSGCNNSCGHWHKTNNSENTPVHARTHARTHQKTHCDMSPTLAHTP